MFTPQSPIVWLYHELSLDWHKQPVVDISHDPWQHDKLPTRSHIMPTQFPWVDSDDNTWGKWPGPESPQVPPYTVWMRLAGLQYNYVSWCFSDRNTILEVYTMLPVSSWALIYFKNICRTFSQPFIWPVCYSYISQCIGTVTPITIKAHHPESNLI